MQKETSLLIGLWFVCIPLALMCWAGPVYGVDSTTGIIRVSLSLTVQNNIVPIILIFSCIGISLIISQVDIK
jgi:hypothetical protein